MTETEREIGFKKYVKSEPERSFNSELAKLDRIAGSDKSRPIGELRVDTKGDYWMWTGKDWKQVPTNIDIYALATLPKSKTSDKPKPTVTERVKRKFEL